jgi:hypothetical protein
MKKVLRINENGLFVEDVILEDEETTPEDCIETYCPGGFFWPKWNGSKWIEGKTVAEIEAIKALSTKVEPTRDDRLAALENAMIEMIMGGTV